MSDIETSDWSEIAANNIQPAPGGWPANSSPMIVYSNGREDMGAIKRDWNRRNPTVTSGGSANAQSLTYTQGPVAYATGQTYTFFAGFTNSGPATLNVNGLGAKNIYFGSAPLTGNELVTGAVVEVIYDGAEFVIMSSSYGKTSTSGCLPLTGGTLTGALVISGASGTSRLIQGRTGASPRWELDLGTNVVESTGNVGSDFAVSRFTDAGAFIDTPLAINRASVQVKINAPSGATAANLPHIDGITGTSKLWYASTSGVDRWSWGAVASVESGGNAGSDFQVNRYTDAGGFIDAPLVIARASGLTSVNNLQANKSDGISIVAPSGQNARYISVVTGVRSWATGPDGAGNWRVDNSTRGTLPLNINGGTDVASFSVAIINGPSDRSLKENVVPLEDSLDKVLALQGVSFDFIGKEGRQIGLIAQDVAPIVPEVIQDYQSQDGEGKPTAGLLAIDYPKLVAVLIEAVKTLNAKVTALEARLPPETLTA